MEGHVQPEKDVGPPRTNDPELHEINSTSKAEEERLEQTLTRKIDLHILPFVVLIYLFSFLDRGTCCALTRVTQLLIAAVNIGNARLYGLEEDLGLVGDQYQVAVSILFVTYCVCGCHVRCLPRTS
jgi:hypothetical protein